MSAFTSHVGGQRPPVSPRIEEVFDERPDPSTSVPTPTEAPRSPAGRRFGARFQVIPTTGDAGSVQAQETTIFGRIKECFGRIKTRFSELKAAVVKYNSAEQKFERQVTVVGKDLAKLMSDLARVADAEIKVTRELSNQNELEFKKESEKLEAKRQAIYKKIPLKGLSPDTIGKIINVAKNAYRQEVQKPSRFASDMEKHITRKDNSDLTIHRRVSGNEAFVLERKSVVDIEMDALEKHLNDQLSKRDLALTEQLQRRKFLEDGSDAVWDRILAGEAGEFNEIIDGFNEGKRSIERKSCENDEEFCRDEIHRESIVEFQKIVRESVKDRLQMFENARQNMVLEADLEKCQIEAQQRRSWEELQAEHERATASITASIRINESVNKLPSDEKAARSEIGEEELRARTELSKSLERVVNGLKLQALLEDQENLLKEQETQKKLSQIFAQQAEAFAKKAKEAEEEAARLKKLLNEDSLTNGGAERDSRPTEVVSSVEPTTLSTPVAPVPSGKKKPLRNRVKVAARKVKVAARKQAEAADRYFKMLAEQFMRVISPKERRIPDESIVAQTPTWVDRSGV